MLAVPVLNAFPELFEFVRVPGVEVACKWGEKSTIMRENEGRILFHGQQRLSVGRLSGNRSEARQELRWHLGIAAESLDDFRYATVAESLDDFRYATVAESLDDFRYATVAESLDDFRYVRVSGQTPRRLSSFDF